MKEQQKVTHPLVWFLALIVGIVIIGFVFTRWFEYGIKIAGSTPPEVKKSSNAPAGPDIRKLRIATPEALAHGKEVFASNCVTCHGAEGKGDGPKSNELNPKPRNYHTDKFKNGNAPLQLAETLRKGLGGMPAFPLMPIEDRFAVIHYIRTFIPKPDNDDAASIDALPKPGAASKSAIVSAPDSEGPRIPIRLAMKLLTEEDHTVASPPKFPVWMKQKNVNQSVGLVNN